jgi:hypothetical protein
MDSQGVYKLYEFTQKKYLFRGAKEGRMMSTNLLTHSGKNNILNTRKVLKKKDLGRQFFH